MGERRVIFIPRYSGSGSARVWEGVSQLYTAGGVADGGPTALLSWGFGVKAGEGIGNLGQAWFSTLRDDWITLPDEENAAGPTVTTDRRDRYHQYVPPYQDTRYDMGGVVTPGFGKD
ncbi:hypothetical protein CEP54_002464 [Fusarium duplospermum]|uniref:Uncharacterized protein n=1 Tax=Fusarium duplospermum TaxID=1325734 RepID=A0A428QUX1_9HYPO|nr:hypothetical protein CEP54_002464 [Fusarium duplospermum]